MGGSFQMIMLWGGCSVGSDRGVPVFTGLAVR